MPIETSIRFHVRCDKCGAPLRPPPYCPGDGPAPVSSFPTSLAAIHRALEAHWIIKANAVFCPICGPITDAETKEA
jgi:hypothetical protein